MTHHPTLVNEQLKGNTKPSRRCQKVKFTVLLYPRQKKGANQKAYKLEL